MDRTRVSATIDRAPAGTPACHNCGAPLTGPFCSRCGQKDVPLDRTLGHMLRDWLEEVASLDSRLVHTLLTLLFRPGGLTADHNAGRRVRYVSPLRLYMVASVLFFFVLTLSPDGTEVEIDLGTDGDSASAEVASAEIASGESQPDAADAAADDAMTEPDGSDVAPDADRDGAESAFEAWIVTQAERAADDPDGFARFWFRAVAWSMFALLPVAAWLLAAVYRRPKRYYVQHLVFTLHAHAFAFLLFTLTIGLTQLLGESGVQTVVDLVATGLITLYLVVALRRVYGGGMIRTALKLGLIAIVYMFALVVVLGGSSFVALGLF